MTVSDLVKARRLVAEIVADREEGTEDVWWHSNISDFVLDEGYGEHGGQNGADRRRILRVPAVERALIAALDRLEAHIRADERRKVFTEFNSADWFWRDLDPDDSGDTPEEAINRGMIGHFTVCHIRSSFAGPDRFCFIAPVLDTESDDDECLCFATEGEAIAAAKERHAILAAAEKEDGK